VSSFDIYDYLNKPKVLQASVPLLDSRRLQLRGIARVSSPPRIEVTLPANQVDGDKIDRAEKCLLYIDVVGATITLITAIDAIENNTLLKLTNLESVSHEQKREFFRIDAQMAVDARKLPPPPEDGTCSGVSINISGNGILVSLPEPLTVDRKVKLRISLPDPVATDIECIGRVVRSEKRKRDRYRVAFNLTTIGEEDQDKIVSFCLAQQRKHIRLGVQVIGPA
jgi:hypothetical protein